MFDLSYVTHDPRLLFTIHSTFLFGLWIPMLNLFLIQNGNKVIVVIFKVKELIQGEFERGKEVVTIHPTSMNWAPHSLTSTVFGTCYAGHCVGIMVIHDTMCSVFHYGLELYQCYGLINEFPNSYVETLIPSAQKMALFGGRSLKVIKLQWGC